MNAAAERLTGYTRADVVGKLALTSLHDPHELTRKPDEKMAKDEHSLEGFAAAYEQGGPGEVDEREWTYIRNDGSTLPVHVAITRCATETGPLADLSRSRRI